MDKGLCISCNYEKSCVFPRRFPILECEEFNNNGVYARHKQSTRVHKVKVCAAQEETVAE